MRLQQFVEDKKNNNLSATRLAFLLWVIGTLIVWAVVSWRTNQLHALPESVVVIIGVLMTGKAVQRFGE